MTENFPTAVIVIKSCEQDNEAFGTGFIIDRNESYVYVLTCAHVFEDTKKNNQVLVNNCRADLVVSGQSQGIDLAVLRVEDEYLKDKLPIPLANIGQEERQFETLGYYDYDTEGKIARRKLSGKLLKHFQVNTNDNQNFVDAWDLLIQDRDRLELGYSGAPVVDTETGYAVGVVSHRIKKGEEGHAISINGLSQIWPHSTELIRNPLDKGKKTAPKSSVSRFGKIHKALPYQAITSSFTVTLSIVVLRFFGAFEFLELQAYDRILTASRVAEKPSTRIVTIEADRADVEAQRAANEPHTLTENISDTALLETISKLKDYGAKIIGIDLYLPPNEKDWTEATAKLFQATPELYGVCAQPHIEGEAIPSPASAIIPNARVGFSNFIQDRDRSLRRQLVRNQLTDEQAGSTCKSELSFNVLIALRYLGISDGKSQPLEDYQNLLTPAPDSNLKVRETLIKRISTYGYGGYHNLEAEGFQLLLNYREPKDHDLRKAFPHFSIQDVRKGSINPEVFKDKIVLIGLTAESYARDEFSTPYGNVFGVTLQAHMIDQILSAVLDGRAMIWVWSGWGEFLWILAWGLLGGLLACYCKRLIILGLLLLIGVGSLYITCMLTMTVASGWIPLVPPLFSFIFTNGIVVYTQSKIHPLVFLKSEVKSINA